MTTPDRPTPDEAAQRPAPSLPPTEPPADVGPSAPAAPPVPTDPSTAAPPVPAEPPTAAELERIAEPARVRRAPKFGAFITAGVLVGFVLAVLAVGVFDAVVDTDTDTVDVVPGSGFLPFLEGRSGVVTVLAVTLGAFGALVGGWLAVLADRRSRRDQDRPSPTG